jgi:hypothetical protein
LKGNENHHKERREFKHDKIWQDQVLERQMGCLMKMTRFSEIIVRNMKSFGDASKDE